MGAEPHTFRHRVVLVRHGETEWSSQGRHTGRSDIPLTERGREQAQSLRQVLSAWSFAAAYVSPLQRARETCSIAGYGDVAVVDDDLLEWDYGTYEGMTTAEVRRSRPGWNIWKDGAPGGEPIAAASARADRMIAKVRTHDGDVLLVAHGHILRMLTARWIEQPALLGQRFRLGIASPCVLYHEHEWHSIWAWNITRGAG